MTNLAKLEQIREQIVHTETEILAIEQGALTAEEAAERLLAVMRDHLDIARTRIGYFLAPGGQPHIESLAETVAILEIISDPSAFETTVRAAFARMARPDAIALDARPAVIAPLQQRLERLLADEEAEVCRLEREGVAVKRREGIDAARVRAMLAAWDAA